MDYGSHTLLVLAIILFFGLILPQFFKRIIQLPFATSLIILGSIMGPSGLNYIEPDDTMKLFGLLGAAFQMLLTGFEVESLHVPASERRIWVLGVMNSVIPFATGMIIVRLFHYSWESSVFMGLAFISSSILMVFANVQTMKIGQTSFGNTIKSLVVIQDLNSLFLTFVLFKYVAPHSRFPLLILLGLLLSSVAIMRMFLPEVVIYFFQRFEKTDDTKIFEGPVRLIIALLLFVLLIFSAMDVHPVIAAFLVGFTLSEIPESRPVKAKLETIGYAMFIPIFFFIVGMEIDLGLITRLFSGNFLIVVLVSGAILSKFFSGWLGARLGKFSAKESVMIGISSTTKLTVAVTATFAALQLRLIDNTLYTSIILLSVITTVLNPGIMTLMLRKWKTVNKETSTENADS